MMNVTYDYSILKLQNKIKTYRGLTILSEKDMTLIFEISSADQWLLAKDGRLKVLWIENGQLFFLLSEVIKWLKRIQ